MGAEGPGGVSLEPSSESFLGPSSEGPGAALELPRETCLG